MDVVTPRVEPADEFPEARVAGGGDEEDIRRGGSAQRPERDVDNHRLQRCRLRSCTETLIVSCASGTSSA